MTLRVHLFPYRTQKLSSVVPKILGWRRPGKIGRCQHNAIHPYGCFAIFSSIAQSVERMTVNHDVTGSSPVGGAKKKALVLTSAFFIDVYLRQMMRALPNAVTSLMISGCATFLRQTSHHCATIESNIILNATKNIISPQGCVFTKVCRFLCRFFNS